MLNGWGFLILLKVFWGLVIGREGFMELVVWYELFFVMEWKFFFILGFGRERWFCFEVGEGL